MGVADGVVGQLQAPEGVLLAADPHAAVAVLVAGEILDQGLHGRAVSVRDIGQGDMAAGGEMAVGPGAAVGHEAVDVRMGDVALELPHPGPTGPDLLAAFLAEERARRMLGQGEPEARRL